MTEIDRIFVRSKYGKFLRNVLQDVILVSVVFYLIKGGEMV